MISATALPLYLCQKPSNESLPAKIWSTHVSGTLVIVIDASGDSGLAWPEGPGFGGLGASQKLRPDPLRGPGPDLGLAWA